MKAGTGKATTDKKGLNLQNELQKAGFVFSRQRLTACVTRKWAGLDSA